MGGMVRGGWALVLALGLALVSAGSGAAQAVDCTGMVPGNPGVIGESAYEGPIFGNTVAWDDAWIVGESGSAFVDEVTGDLRLPVDCEGNTGDRLTLVHADHPEVVVTVQSYQVGMWTFEDMAAELEHPGWVNNLALPEGSEVLVSNTEGTDLAILARSTDAQYHVAYQAILFPEGAEQGDPEPIRSVTIHIFAPDAVADAFGAAESLELDGMDPFAVFTAEDLVTVVEATSRG